MNFNEYLQDAWMRHETDAQLISDDFKSKLKAVENEENINLLSRLITHVCGNHLGQWEIGIELLRKLKNNPLLKDKSEINRSIAILTLGNFPDNIIDGFNISDQIRILSGTASALSNLGGVKNCKRFLIKANQLIEENILELNDPAYRALAMSSNNIASAIYPKENVSKDELELMIMAANFALKYWAIAGTWKEIERAHYCLAQSNLKIKDMSLARHHADVCLEIVLKNQNEALEAFFAYEILALIEKENNNDFALSRAKELMKNTFDLLTQEEQEWCEGFINKL
jgi:hypothetical protein